MNSALNKTDHAIVAELTTRILLVEDDPESCEAMQRGLERRGITVTPAKDGEQALSLFSTTPDSFDAVVSDIRLGGVDGVELLRRIRQTHPDLPVILITGYDPLDSAIEAVRLGAQDYILKPLDKIEDLMVPLNRAVQNHRTLIENRALNARLVESEKRFREFFESEPEYCYMVSPEGLILNLNRAALQALGYAKSELTGQPIKAIYAPECHSKAMAAFAIWKETGEVRDEELTILAKDGSRRVVLLNSSAVRDDHETILHSVSIQCDITERKKAEAERLVYQEKLRQLALDLTLSEEKQRRRIAVDLHDSLGVDVCRGKIDLQKILDAGIDLDADLRAKLEGVLALLSSAMDEVRSLTFDLFPPTLYAVGLIPALEDLADRVTGQWGVHVTVQADEGIDPLHKDDRILLYRAARELLENVGKHAHASRGLLRLSVADSRVELKVEDNGKGFDVSASPGKGIGLLSLKERLFSLGGEFGVESTIGKGTIVRIKMPVRKEGEG